MYLTQSKGNHRSLIRCTSNLNFVVIGYPHDFDVNYAHLNGFLCNVCYSFQMFGTVFKSATDVFVRKNFPKTFLNPKFVISMIN